MVTLSSYFGVLMEFGLVTLLMLTVGAIVTALARQPIEKIRAIQLTLLAVVAVPVLREAKIVPALPVAWNRTLAVQLTPADPVVDVRTGEARAIVNLARPERSADAASNGVRGRRNETQKAAPSLGNRFVRSPWVVLRAGCVLIVLCGAVWRIALWLFGRWKLAALLRTAVPADWNLLAAWRQRDEAARRGIRILVSEELDVPFTCGIRRPAIVVPKSFCPSASGQLDACLTHEWAHVERRDALVWLLVRVVEPFIWYQPFFWRLKRELRVCQDQVADHYVVEGSGDRTGYAELLASLSRRRAMGAAIPALSMADRPSHLRRRIELLLSDSSKINMRTRRLAIVAIGLTLTISALLVAAAETKKGEEAPAPAKANQQAQAGESLSYTGTIVDARTKKPLAGAEVSVRRLNHTGPDGRIIAETHHTTDAAGKYHFVIPPEQVAERRLYVDLGVKHPSYVSIGRMGMSLSGLLKNQKLGEPPFVTRIGLQPSDPVSGRIVDPDGQPVAGAKVRAYTSRNEKDLNGGNWPVVDSDSDGRFKIEAVAGGPCIIGIVPDKFAPHQIILGAKHGDQGEIRLEEGVWLQGVVVDARDQPVVGVWVNVYDKTEGDKIKMSVVTSVSRSCLTDAHGRFQLRPLKSHLGQLRVEDSPSEARFRRGVLEESVPVNDVFLIDSIDLSKIDTALPITVKALPEVKIRGRFVDSKGKPTTGWDIRASGQIGEKWFFDTWYPDLQGNFSGKMPVGAKRAQFDAVSNADHALRVRLHPGEPLKRGRDFELGEIQSDLTGIEIVKYDSPVVQVSVIDKTGVPVQGAKMAAIYANGDKTDTPTATGLPTNVWFERQKDGRYRTEQMVPDVKTTITAKAEGYEDASETVTLPESAEKQMTLTLKKKSGDGAAK